MARLPAIAALLLAATGSELPAGGATRERDVPAERQERGLTFARQRCSSCHSVVENGISPNPEAPSFQEIANRAGVTSVTLRQFLIDSHNYPMAMDFKVKANQAADLSEYIVTLKMPDYRPIL